MQLYYTPIPLIQFQGRADLNTEKHMLPCKLPPGNLTVGSVYGPRVHTNASLFAGRALILPILERHREVSFGSGNSYLKAVPITRMFEQLYLHCIILTLKPEKYILLTLDGRKYTKKYKNLSFSNFVFQLQLTFNIICISFRCAAQWLDNHMLRKVVPPIFPVPTWPHTQLIQHY